MNRCAPSLLALALACTGVLATLAPAPVAAQSAHRSFTKAALRGKIAFGAPPAITMNGIATTLAPGYRVHGVDNLIVMTAQLVGGTATVDYTTDVEGHVYEVWILSPTEAAKLWPVAREQAAAWKFDQFAQTWTKP